MVVKKPFLLPGLHLSISVNVWSMTVRPSRGVNGGGLGYQKRTRECRTLGVVLYAEFCVNVILGRSATGEGRKDDAMRNGQPTDFQGSEKSRRVGGRRHLSLELRGMFATSETSSLETIPTRTCRTKLERKK